MDTENDWVVVGRFGRPHGIKGLITVVSFTEPRDNILHYADWHARLNLKWSPLALRELEMNNKFILARVEGYDEREDVARLTNIEIAIKREQLPVLGEGDYYWHELMGMNVVNLQGIVLGNIVEMMPTGANDVMVIVGEKRYLVPYLPGKYVVDVDDIGQIMTVNWDVDF